MKKTLIVIAVFCLAVPGRAQLSSLFKSNDNYQYVKDAVEGGSFVVTSSYFVTKKGVLQDSNTDNTLYTRKNREDFNAQYAFGVKLRGGYWLANKAVTPWVNDSVYAAYEDEYDPLLRKVTYYIPDTKKSDDFPENIDSNMVPTSHGLGYLVTDEESFNNDGFVYMSSTDSIDGFAIWITLSEDQKLGAKSGFEYQVTKQKVLLRNARDSMNVIEPNGILNKKPVIGGIYARMQQTAVGQMSLVVYGIIVEHKGKWVVETLVPAEETPVVEESVDEAEEPIEEELEPVTKSMKNIKKAIGSLIPKK